MSFKIIVLLLLYSLQVCYAENNKTYDYPSGKVVDNNIAPYLNNFCSIDKVNCEGLVKLLIDDDAGSKNNISSTPYYIDQINSLPGHYFQSKTSLIYDIKELSPRHFIILYSKWHPERLLNSKNSNWNIALVDNKLNILDMTTFVTAWKYNNSKFGMWDMILTQLYVQENLITSKISYVHTGSGGGRDQEFTFNAKLNGGNIKDAYVRQSIDACKDECQDYKYYHH